MESTFAELAAELTQKNIRASHQRIKILQYLVLNRCHPTVDEIYHALHEEIPSLSRTTIYNTLALFQEKGLVRVLSIEENEARFDILVADHGHFKCEACGTIYNFHLDFSILKSQDLSQFRVTEQNVYFKGLCPDCLASGSQKED
jgi:Fe2+ or Zn2+ uptake regulation protein